jgi:hypothetical protein
MRRNAVTRTIAFLAKERSISVLLILLAVLGLGGVVLRLTIFQSWFLWFWAMTALAAFELLATAAWDLVVEFRGGSLYLVTDQQAPWGPWVQWSVVPVLLIAGIVVDHFLVH